MRYLALLSGILGLWCAVAAQEGASFQPTSHRDVGLSGDTARTSPEASWRFTIAPYLLVPNMSGTTAVGNLPPADVDASPSDIFSHLHFGAMLYFQAAKGPWAFALDGIYMDLKQDLVAGGGRLSGTVQAKQGALEGFVFRKLAPTFEVGVGGLGNHLQVELNAALVTPPGGAQRAKSKSEMWGLPVVATRWTPLDAEHWHVALFGDIGTLGSDNWTWQVLPSVGYKFGQTFELALQYRVIGITYESGTGQDFFRYDMRIFGPQIGFAFHF